MVVKGKERSSRAQYSSIYDKDYLEPKFTRLDRSELYYLILT